MLATIEDVKALAKSGDYGVIPICRELYADQTTAIRVLEILKETSSHCYLLESVDDAHRWGRYSFLGFDPTMEITCTDGIVSITTGGTTVSMENADPRQTVRQVLEDNRSPRLPGMPTFTGGLVGFFSYDYLKYSEPGVVLDAHDSEGFKDLDVMLFDKVIAFDNARQKIVFIANVRTDDIACDYRRALRDIDQMMRLVADTVPQRPAPGKLLGEFTPLFDHDAYCAMVERAKEFIFEGDIFQVVLSNRLAAPFKGSLINTYRVLRTTNPSPYMFYFASNSIEVAGASPEALAKLDDGMLYSFPLAGTRPRGADDSEDERLRTELLADAKELAEHNMLVDLGRNDIGKVSEFGSVEVERYQEVLEFSHVMHIGSEVRGKLRSDCTALDALDAVLPAGTLSGAPKLRAAEIINQLEDDKRGIYGGAIGYLDFTGNMDVCIAIRLAYAKGGKVFVRSGAGIVADSVPDTEFRECINKAQAVVSALQLAQEDDAL